MYFSIFGCMQTRFRLDAPLGVGPDGLVHRGFAERLGARPVAVRRLPIPNGPARRTLRTDAETIAALGHPALAVVDDIVDLDDDNVLVASTLGTDGTLADRLVLGPLPLDQAIEIVRTVADAIRSAHGLGLCHGHLTPNNVLLTGTGPVVCDLVQAGALDRPRDRDAADLVHLASQLVDAEDRSPRAAAYRSLCRWSTESDVGLDGFVAALARLDELPEPPAVAPPDEPPRPAPRDDASIGLVVGASLAVGTLLGAIGTVLPRLG